MSLAKPQPIQVAVQTATSDYALCVQMDGIYLYNDAEEKVIWHITAPKKKHPALYDFTQSSHEPFVQFRR